MKNVKLNLKKAAKAGFSLVEMLVVIAIIGIIAAIAIPNIGNINAASKEAAAQRNAQQVASTYNAAVSAGAPAEATLAAAFEAVQDGTLVVADGPFAGKVFTVGDIPADTETEVLGFLDWNAVDGTITYAK